jgi:hypothetical protein
MEETVAGAGALCQRKRKRCGVVVKESTAIASVIGFPIRVTNASFGN